jgi:phage shock protein PspC (stress-responsive transcriptional regulator)
LAAYAVVLANYFGMDATVVRIIFVIVALAFGTGLLAYLILWVAVPVVHQQL